MPSYASDRRRSWSVTSGVRPAVTLAYSARHDVGGGRAANPRPRPRPRLRCLAPPPWRPHRTVGRQIPGGAGERAPGWGRLRPASGGVDHRPCSRPPWLGMNGIVRGGGEGGATPGGGGGCGGGGRAGGGGVAMRPPPASSSRCVDSCGGGAGVTSETTDDEQTTIKS